MARTTSIGLARILATGLLLPLASGCALLPTGFPPADNDSDGWIDQAGGITGIVDFRQTDPDLLSREHTGEPVRYTVRPPVGGDHDPVWQNCQGRVYERPVRNEHAVHSLEHGAVWVTYRPDLPADQVAALAERVEGTDKLFMSPYPDLGAPVSLQAWGYQLKVQEADDRRIDEFIEVLRVNASLEGPTAVCDGGVTDAAGNGPAGAG